MAQMEQQNKINEVIIQEVKTVRWKQDKIHISFTN